jgi:thermitase
MVRRTGSQGLVCAALVVLLLPSAVPEAGPPTRFIVGFADAVPAHGSTWQGARVVDATPPLRFVVVESYERERFAARAQAQAGVRYVALDGPVHGLEAWDPLAGQQYGLAQIGAFGAWNVTTGTGASICVVDTGVRHTHEDLVGGRYRGGWDFVNADADPWDDHGHGTHVAGIAAATTGNGLGIAGVAQADVYAVKVLNRFNTGTWSNVANGILWCANEAPGRTVINLSLGGSNPPQALSDAIDHARAAGKLLVAASGNGGCLNCVLWPAKHPDVVAVTCTNATEAACSLSSRGPEATLAAPGAGILSLDVTADDAYRTMTGTSMSAPHASGVAALVWSHWPDLTALEVEHRLLAAAHDLGPSGHDDAYGHGRVDAPCALTCAVAPPLAPAGLTATREGLDQVRLAWHAPTDPWLRYVTGYTVWRADAPGGPYEAVAHLGVVLEHVDTAPPLGSRYYVVTARNVGGDSTASAEACHSPTPLAVLPCVPAPPT